MTTSLSGTDIPDSWENSARRMYNEPLRGDKAEKESGGGGSSVLSQMMSHSNKVSPSNAGAAEEARLASIAATIKVDDDSGALTQAPACCNPDCPGEAAQRLLTKAEQWKQLDADRLAKEAAAGGAAAAQTGEPEPEPEPEQQAEAEAFREKTAASAAAALVPDALKAKKKLQRCSKCKAVQYCGRECQVRCSLTFSLSFARFSPLWSRAGGTFWSVFAHV